MKRVVAVIVFLVVIIAAVGARATVQQNPFVGSWESSLLYQDVPPQRPDLTCEVSINVRFDFGADKTVTMTAVRNAVCDDGHTYGPQTLTVSGMYDWNDTELFLHNSRAPSPEIMTYDFSTDVDGEEILTLASPDPNNLPFTLRRTQKS